MAFVSSGYNPKKPMEDRITDIGPRHYEEFYPPAIKANERSLNAYLGRIEEPLPEVEAYRAFLAGDES